VRAPPPPALDPERPTLVQPWREFQSRGWVQVFYHGSDLSVECKILACPPILTQDEKGKEVYLGAAAAKQRILDLGLWSPVKKGGKAKASKGTELPKKSICKKDFEGNDQSLLSRARSVANTLGETTAAGRIGSMHLSRKGKDTFQSWWDGTGADRKARLLSDKKHYDSLSREDKERLDTVLADCPFRGDRVVPTQEEEEQAPAPTKKKEDPTPSGDGKSNGRGKGKAVAQQATAGPSK
jgi:hypothetical protein